MPIVVMMNVFLLNSKHHLRLTSDRNVDLVIVPGALLMSRSSITTCPMFRQPSAHTCSLLTLLLNMLASKCIFFALILWKVEVLRLLGEFLYRPEVYAAALEDLEVVLSTCVLEHGRYLGALELEEFLGVEV